LSRDAVLFACARLNTVVSGTGHPDHRPRQERAIGLICNSEDLRRINAFAAVRPGGDLPMIFFRGQLLELMRWAVRCCPAIPDDGTTLNNPTARTRPALRGAAGGRGNPEDTASSAWRHGRRDRQGPRAATAHRALDPE